MAYIGGIFTECSVKASLFVIDILNNKITKVDGPTKLIDANL